jgi:hypothetical protein
VYPLVHTPSTSAPAFVPPRRHLPLLLPLHPLTQQLILLQPQPLTLMLPHLPVLCPPTPAPQQWWPARRRAGSQVLPSLHWT